LDALSPIAIGECAQLPTAADLANAPKFAFFRLGRPSLVMMAEKRIDGARRVAKLPCGWSTRLGLTSCVAS